MSTLSFLPYISEHFSKEYIIPNYLGESLSSLVPGTLAMLQSYGRPEKPCSSTNTSLTLSNHTLSNSTGAKLNLVLYSANYSVSLYFGLLFMLILSSIVSFSWLNYSSIALKARKKKVNTGLEMDMLEETHHHETDSNNIKSNNSAAGPKKDLIEKRILISLAFLTCFINYGYLPGLLSVRFIFIH